MVDYVDFTLLQKKGLLREKREEAVKLKENSWEENPKNNDALAFLTNIAGAESKSSVFEDNSSCSYDLDIKDLKTKVENLEYKLKKLSERLDNYEN